MKKILLLLCCLSSVLSACGSITPKVETQPSIVRNDMSFFEPRLIVNGNDITEGNYIYIDHENYNACLPVIAVFNALGYNAEMIFDDMDGSYSAMINGEEFLSSSEDGYGLPGGDDTDVRIFTGNDFIIDVHSLATQMYWVWHANIIVDYSSSTITVKTVDPITYDPLSHTNIPCSLMINNKDITQNDRCEIRMFDCYTDAVLPLRAVVAALGGRTVQKKDIVTIISKNGSLELDISEPGFGVVVSPDITMIRVRETAGDEIYMDSNSLQYVLKDLFDFDLIIDTESSSVYIYSGNT